MNSAWFTQAKALPIIAIVSLLLAIVIVKTRPSSPHQDQTEFVSLVNVISVKQHYVKPAIKGFGIVKPDILFEAKAEVSGKISYLHPQLKDGVVFPKDTVVIRIEADDYQSSLKQAQASSEFNIAKLNEVKVNIKNAQVELNLAKAKLKLAMNDFMRVTELLNKHLVSQADVDAKQNTVLKLKQEVQNLNKQLQMLPQQQRSIEANLANTDAVTSSQQRNLERTTITLPFNARISTLNVEKNQYVNQGNLLFSAQTTDKMLINAQFPQIKFRTLAKDFKAEQDLIRQAFQTGFSSNLFTNLGLTAQVRLDNDSDIYWQAKVERISSSLDPKTRSLGVFVSVDKPNTQIIPGFKPPLLEGMYTEVTIKGKPKPFFVIPRDAMHEGEIFIVNQNNQLERRAIKPSLFQGSMALFEQGLVKGEKIIVTDLFPAIIDMPVQYKIDKEQEKNIIDWVAQQEQH